MYVCMYHRLYYAPFGSRENPVRTSGEFGYSFHSIFWFLYNPDFTSLQGGVTSFLPSSVRLLRSHLASGPRAQGSHASWGVSVGTVFSHCHEKHQWNQRGRTVQLWDGLQWWDEIESQPGTKLVSRGPILFHKRGKGSGNSFYSSLLRHSVHEWAWVRG